MSQSSEQIAGQLGDIYPNYNKLKYIDGVGYFLENYVVSGGIVTKDIYQNDTINVTDIVVSLENDVTSRQGESFKTKIPNATYYLDYQTGDFVFGTSHPDGSYLPVAEVRTDGNRNVLAIVDKRGVTGGFRLQDDYMYPQIAELTDQMEDTTAKMTTAKTIVPENYTGPIVTFIDDDGTESFLEKWKPLCDARGIRIDLAIVPTQVGQQYDPDPNIGYRKWMDFNTIKQLHQQGYGVVSHSMTHTNLEHLTTDQLEYEFGDSYKWIKDNGFAEDENVVVYPFGIQPYWWTVKQIARKYYNYGVTTGNATNAPLYDNMYVLREFVDGSDINYLKTTVDNAITNKTWLVFLTHAWATGCTAEKLTQLVDYIISKGVPIMRCKDAIKKKGYTVAAGEFNDVTNQGVYINRNGENNIPYKMVTDATVYNTNTPLSTFEKNKITIVPLIWSNDLLTSQGGTMTVYHMPPNEDFAYATFTPFNRNELYMKKWVSSSNAWGAWELISKSANGVVPLASADPMVIPAATMGNVFRIQGNTSFGTFLAADGGVGREVTLIFDGNLRIFGGVIKFSGGGNLDVTPYSVVKLINTSDAWVEVSRSIK